MFKQLELKISGLQKYTHKWITKFGGDCFIIICHSEQLVVIPAQAYCVDISFVNPYLFFNTDSYYGRHAEFISASFQLKKAFISKK